MKTLFDADYPVYRIGKCLYQQIDEAVTYRYRPINRDGWVSGLKCTPREWQVSCVNVGVIHEDTV